MPASIILSALAFTIFILFYLYALGSFYGIHIFPFINRVTSIEAFEAHILNEYLDNVVVIVTTIAFFWFSVNNKILRNSICIAYGIACSISAIIGAYSAIFSITSLLSLPIIIGITLYHHKQQKKNIVVLNFNANLILRYISMGVIAISAMSIVSTTSSIFLGRPILFLSENNYSNELFLLLSSFSPIYIFLLISCVPVKVVFKEASTILKFNLKQDIGQQEKVLSNDHVPNNDSASNKEKKNNKGLSATIKIGFLFLAMLLAVIVVMIPQLPSINKDNQDIGVDTHYYRSWITEMAKSTSPSDFVYKSFIVQGQDGDRALSLIIMFLIYQLSGADLSDTIEYFPVILGPGIVLALYFLASELTRNEKISLIAAFLGTVSFHTLAGVYAGFYANWLALIVGYISIVFLFRYLRSGYRSDIVVFLALLFGVQFLHVYTWTLLTAVAAIFLLALLVIHGRTENKRNKNNKNSGGNFYSTNKRIICLLLFAIVPTILADFAKVAFTGSSGGLEQDLALAQTGLGIEQFDLRWEILDTTIHHSLGGVFSNFIILTLGLLWVLKSNIRETVNIFLMTFLSAGLIPLFFGSWALQARVLYDIPFEIPAAIALYYLSKRLGSILLSLAGCSWLAAVCLFTVANYYFIQQL